MAGRGVGVRLARARRTPRVTSRAPLCTPARGSLRIAQYQPKRLALCGAASTTAAAPTRTIAPCVAHRASARMVERNTGSLENRFGPLGPTRVRIPPPPPTERAPGGKPLCVRRPTVFVTAAPSPTKSTGVSARPLSLWVTGAHLAHRGRSAALARCRGEGTPHGESDHLGQCSRTLCTARQLVRRGVGQSPWLNGTI